MDYFSFNENVFSVNKEINLKGKISDEKHITLIKL